MELVEWLDLGDATSEMSLNHLAREWERGDSPRKIGILYLTEDAVGVVQTEATDAQQIFPRS